MSRLVRIVKVAFGLGIINIVRAVSYRLLIKIGIGPVPRLKDSTALRGPFFSSFCSEKDLECTRSTEWVTSAKLFSYWPLVLTKEPPDWMANPFTAQRVASSNSEWWKIADFDPAVGDIKVIWELSRMDWVLALAQQSRHGDGDAMTRLNNWLADWCLHNPPYRGPNWKCGQEAAIRVMHLAMAAVVLQQTRRPPVALIGLVHQHLQRIAPTIGYAISQDNNHGTSEAAALFIGGSWLVDQGLPEGQRWERMGRRWLENRVARLIGKQGSFSQYSLNYHRVMLDTLSMTEVWRRSFNLPAFSCLWRARALAAAQWLRYMVNPINGDGPNLGANDGARLLQLTKTPYRDHRPSVQMAMALFANQRAYPLDGPYDDGLRWLAISLPEVVAPALGSFVADDGGFSVIRRGGAMVMLRYPRFRFRPSQADALHLDFWVGGENLLRDAGTYSYNTQQHWSTYFGGVASHNTVQFDDRDQMPRLSRFLFGDWLKTNWLQPLEQDERRSCFGAGYSDAAGSCHRRIVRLSDSCLHVLDDVQGFAHKAVLRWRLAPGLWKMTHTPDGIRLAFEDSVTLIVRADIPIVRCELVGGWESRHYMEKTSIPVLEVEVHHPGKLTTEVGWPA